MGFTRRARLLLSFSAIFGTLIGCANNISAPGGIPLSFSSEASSALTTMASAELPALESTETTDTSTPELTAGSLSADSLATPTPIATPIATTVASACQAWTAAQPSPNSASWSGNLTSCSAGDIDSRTRSQTLALVNYYRSLAGLSAVSDNSLMNQQAQSCALMMAANNKLSHQPTSDWTCFDPVGASSAALSLLATTQSTRAIELYMLDSGSGNLAAIAHRRWILSNHLGPAIGIGSTSTHSCLQVANSSNTISAKSWAAWPPPGIVPLQAANVDSTGWTVQSDTIDLSTAAVTVQEGSTSLLVSVRILASGYGSKYAIAFTPDGWSSTPGRTYTVTISGISQTIKYTVTFANCP